MYCELLCKNICCDSTIWALASIEMLECFSIIVLHYNCIIKKLLFLIYCQITAAHQIELYLKLKKRRDEDCIKILNNLLFILWIRNQSPLKRKKKREKKNTLQLVVCQILINYINCLFFFYYVTSSSYDSIPPRKIKRQTKKRHNIPHTLQINKYKIIRYEHKRGNSIASQHRSLNLSN